jgi:hypothetical protein
LALLVTEVLGNLFLGVSFHCRGVLELFRFRGGATHGKTGQGDTGTGSRRLVHLTEHQCDLGIAVELNDRGLLHFVVQIVTLTGTLTDSSEDRVTTVSLGDVVDQLLDKHGLADTRTTEETDLSTTSVGGEQVDDLDTGNQNLSSCRLVDELGSLGVNRPCLVALDGSPLVDGLTNDVQNTAKGASADTLLFFLELVS